MTSVRECQLQQIQNVTHYFSHHRFKIDLHTIKLKAFLRKLTLEKSALRRNPKCRRILLNPAIKRPRMIYDTVTPPSKILKRRIHKYKAIDNYIYALLLSARKDNHDSDQALRYHVNINFMCRLRSGLLIKQENGVWDQAPFLFESSTCTVRNNIPLGLAVVIIGLGIPDKYTKAMFSDISRFALNLPSNRNVTLCIEIRIATMQLEGEDVIGTKYRADVDQLCRSLYIDRVIIRKDANLQPLKLLDALSSSSYNNMNMIGEEEGKEGDCCSICLRGGCNSSLPCSHVYHYDCIFKWMSKYNSCPMCRHPYQRVFHPIRTIHHQTHDEI